MPAQFNPDLDHCSNHAYNMFGCRDCEMYVLYQLKREPALVKAVKIGVHALEIKPGEPGPKLQLIRQQTTRKLFVFLQNAQTDAVKAISKKAKELGKVSDVEKRDLFLGAAIVAISWSDLIKEITSDLTEAMKTGLINGFEQLSVVKAQDQIDQLAADYANKRAAEMVSKQWQDNKLVDLENAKYSIAETTKDDLRDIIEQSLSTNSIAKIDSEIAEAGIFGKKRAELIAKTEIAMAQSKGNLDVWKSSGKIKSVEIVTSVGHDVEDLCDKYVAQNPHKLDKAPSLPLHPHCNCSMVVSELIEQ